MSAPSKRISPAVGIFQPQDQPADRGLAAAGFADQPERLAGIDVEAHVLHRAHGAARAAQAAATSKCLVRLRTDKQRLAVLEHRPLSQARRRPPPR